MRISTTIALSAALATTACSNGPSTDDINAANEALKACAVTAGQKQTLEITSAVLDVPKDATAQTKPSYAVSAKVPTYWEKRSGKNDKILDTQVSTSLTFTSVSGAISITSSTSTNSTSNQKGERVEGGVYNAGINLGKSPEQVAKDAVINNVKVADMVAALPDCGKQAYAKLGL